MSQTDCRLADRSRVEGRGLEGQGGGILYDFGIQTAHDTGDRDGSIIIADHQGVLVDVSLNTVEGLENEGLLKALDADLADLARIEGVHGLTHLEHEVVCEVGEEVDTAHSAVEKTNPHVDGADAARDVLNLQAGITLTERILDFEVDLLKLVVSLKIGGIERLELSACESGELARYTVVPPEVGTVGKRLVVNLKDDIVNLVNVLDIGAVGHVVGDFHDAGMVVADSDFGLGAAHSVGHKARERTRCDLDLAELCADLGESGFHADAYIRRAAYYIGQLGLARVDLEKMELL